MKEPTTKIEVTKALNQLIAIIAGGKSAKESLDLQNRPQERVKYCYQLAIAEQSRSFGNLPGQNQVQRKLNSLHSLSVLAQLADEVEWE